MKKVITVARRMISEYNRVLLFIMRPADPIYISAISSSISRLLNMLSCLTSFKQFLQLCDFILNKPASIGRINNKIINQYIKDSDHYQVNNMYRAKKR